MYNVTRLIHLAEGAWESGGQVLSAELRGTLADAERRLVEPTLAGSRNGGDILFHAAFDSETSWRAAEKAVNEILDRPLVAHVDGVDYEAGPVPALGPPGTVYRTLLLAVATETAKNTVDLFEADLSLMPHYVSTITACRLSHPLHTVGTSGWTHVFEQQFTDEQGLMGAYLMHPIHWARVDRWFDPECPEYIVRERVCHSFCQMDDPVLT